MIANARKNFRALVNNAIPRGEWVKRKLAEIEDGGLLLDAGCGEQQYRKFCGHLAYRGQDFGKFEVDEAQGLAASHTKWEYGALDYVGNIWDIDEKDATFDAILCTEVLEHVPEAGATILEFGRLLKPGGKLLLTVPSNSLRHQDPFFFTAGYSDHYLRYWLEKAGFTDISIEPQGDYHLWLMCEDLRSMRAGTVLAKIAIFPAFLYRYLKQRHPTPESVATLCLGYHVSAVRG